MKSILIVDDNKEIGEFLEDLFHIRGFEVVTCLAGEKAIEAGGSRRFDAAFVDIFLPGMDGVEVVERLNRLQPRMRIFLMSGYPTVEKVEKGLKVGAEAFLKKPFGVEDILEMMKKD
ncbi:response regulator [bacterium]|nr:MAG: response regulator [bacterium]